MDIVDVLVLITGGTGGFGGATACRLTRSGAKVVIADMLDERGESLAAELGNGAIYVRADTMDEQSMEQVVDAAIRLEPLRAAVITHDGPSRPGKGGRSIDRDGSRVSLVHFNLAVF